MRKIIEGISPYRKSDKEIKQMLSYMATTLSFMLGNEESNEFDNIDLGYAIQTGIDFWGEELKLDEVEEDDILNFFYENDRYVTHYLIDELELQGYTHDDTGDSEYVRV